MKDETVSALQALEREPAPWPGSPAAALIHARNEQLRDDVIEAARAWVTHMGASREVCVGPAAALIAAVDRLGDEVGSVELVRRYLHEVGTLRQIAARAEVLCDALAANGVSGGGYVAELRELIRKVL